MILSSQAEHLLKEMDPDRGGEIEPDEIEIADILLKTGWQSQPIDAKCQDIAYAFFTPAAVAVAVFPITPQANAQILHGFRPVCQRSGFLKSAVTSPIDQDGE